MSDYLTSGLPGTGGTIKECPEDFRVEEIPLYPPCGSGEHTYLTVEKRGITTLEALRRLSRATGVPERELGYAGMKDARALTVQTVSIPRVVPEHLLALDIPGLRLVAAVRHTNKLRLGHLAGNRFRIRIREVAAGAAERGAAIIGVLAQRGVPNRFGVQRYGVQGNSHLIGGAWLRRDFRGAVDLLMGDPCAVDEGDWRRAIEAYRQGEWQESLRLFPPFCRTERDVLQRLARRPDAWERALQAVSPRLKRLYLSAFQSCLFDRYLAGRLSEFDRCLAGDLAYKHANGACFLVTDPAAEAERAARFEISPSGPMFGCKMILPAGEPRRMEEEILAAEGLTLAAFDLPGDLRLEGERRPLRVPLGDPRIAGDTDGLLVEFTLPKGAYATSVLREVMKAGVAGQNGRD